MVLPDDCYVMRSPRTTMTLLSLFILKNCGKWSMPMHLMDVKSPWGERKCNYSVKHTWSGTSKPVIVKVNWQALSRSVHREASELEKQRSHWGWARKQGDREPGWVLSSVTPTAVHLPQSWCQLGILPNSLKRCRFYKNLRNISLLWLWNFKSYSVDIWHTCWQPKWIF